MDAMRIEKMNLPAGNPLAAAYVENFSSVRELYHWDPRSSDDYRRRSKEAADRFDGSHREALVRALEEYMRMVGASPAAHASAQRLRDPNAVVVITGQQGGLLTGPLYTVHKALTAVLDARRLERELGVPCVPVFWVAAEDHDYDEVNHCYVMPESGRVQRLGLRHRPADRTMVGRISVPSEAVAHLRRELDAILPEGDGRADLESLILNSWERTDNLADWCVAQLADLFAGTELVFLNATRPDLRRLVAPVFKRAVEENAQLRSLAVRASTNLQYMGFAPQVDITPDGTMLFFCDEKGRRFPVDVKDGGYVVRGLSDRVWSSEELARQAERSPESFSSGVLLRPIVQDFLLPVLAYVGGPAEIAYHALQGDLFRHFGVSMPILLSRYGFTLVDSTTNRHLQKFGLALEDVIRRPGLVDDYLHERDALGIADRFALARHQVDAIYDELAAWLGDVQTQLSEMGQKSRRTVLHKLELLENKTRQLHRSRYDIESRQLERLLDVLYPNGVPQERVLCPASFIAKYGVSFVSSLVTRELETEQRIHRAIYL